MCDAAHAALRDEETSVESIKLLYQRLLLHVETALETARLESCKEADASSRKVLDALHYDKLADLDRALPRLQQLVADVERGVKLTENVSSCRGYGGPTVTSPASASASDPIERTVEALSRVDQKNKIRIDPCQ